MALKIKKATRELIWTKIALMSPSGGGKTYSALRLATGMLAKLKEMGLQQNGRILMINTEQKRGYYYANEFEYDIYDVVSPHEPEKYISIIEEAVAMDYPILILDSSSHEWEGKGGCLELHQKAGGTYQSWAKVTPRHNKFLEAIADSPIHIIATMRGKDQYEIEKKENEKLNVKKLGVGAKQREGFEYEFTVTFLLDQKSNMAEVQKDNTHIFEEELAEKLTERHGERIIIWANSGEGYTPPVRDNQDVTEIEKDKYKIIKKNVIELTNQLGGSKNQELVNLFKQFDPSGNPNRIKDVDILENLYTEMSKLKLPEDNNA